MSVGDDLLARANDASISSEERRKAYQQFKNYAPESNDPRLKDAQRLQDIDVGEAIGKRFIDDGSLGRIDETRSSEITSLIDQRRAQLDKANATEGFSAPELQAQQDVATKNINRQGQLAQRSLRAQQARSGVGGGTALSQQQRAIADTSMQQKDFQRDLLLRQRSAIQEDRNIQATRLGDLQSSVENARANETASRKFNLEQAAKERFGQLSTALGFAALGSQERGSEGAISAQMEAARAAMPGKGGFLSKLF